MSESPHARPATPPRPLEWLLSGALPSGQREFVIGDLREEYAERRLIAGRLSSWIWYGREVARSIPVGLRSRARMSARWRDGAVPVIGPPPVPRGLGDRLGGLARSARYAGRSMKRTPGRTTLIAGTLAIGIGATTAVFTIVDRVLLRAPPYDDPSELVTVWNTYDDWRGHEVLGKYAETIALSYPEYVDWRADQTSFESVAVYSLDQATLAGAGDPAQVAVGLASASLWPLLGVEPVEGRAFAPEESGPGAPALAMLSHELWTRRWGGDPDMIGSTIRLDDRPYSVVGVLPPGLRFLPVGLTRVERIDVWLPVGARGRDLGDRGLHAYEAIARTGPGGLKSGAVEETRRLIWRDADPDVRGVRIVPRLEQEVATTRGPLLLLLGSVGVLMLIACVNVATLFLGGVAGRRAELATRMALGAGRGRLASQLAVEAVIHGALGIVGGVLLGVWALRALVRWAPSDLALPPGITLDLRVMAIMSALGLATSLVFGLVPTVLLRRLHLRGEIGRSAGRTMAAGWAAQKSLVGAQFGLSVVLLIGTGLLARSLAAELSVDPGFRGQRLLSVYVSLPASRYPTSGARSAFVTEATARLAAVPGITSVSGISALPFSGRGGSSSFEIRGRETPPGQNGPEALRRAVLPGLHEALSIPVIAGRTFEASDRDGAAPVAIISRSMQERFWPAESPLGRHIVRDAQEWEIVGIVEDVLTDDLTAAFQPTFYTPFHQEEPGWRQNITMVVQAGSDPAGLAGAVRQALWSLDPSLPLEEIEPVPDLVSRATAAPRYRTFLLSSFALIAALLSGVGAFGVVARTLFQRARELGIRLALGATPGRLIREEVGREMIAVAIGLAGGIIVAVIGVRLVTSFLYDVSPYDPLTYGIAVSSLAGLGSIATLFATRRIARLDPAHVLRES